MLSFPVGGGVDRTGRGRSPAEYRCGPVSRRPGSPGARPAGLGGRRRLPGRVGRVGDFGRARGGAPASRGCRTSPCRTSAGARSARRRRRPSCRCRWRRRGCARARRRSARGRARRSAGRGRRRPGSPTWRWSTWTPSEAATSSMTWRAWSARLTSDSAWPRGTRCSTTASATSRRAPRTVWTRSMSRSAASGPLGGLAARPVGAFDVDQAAIGEPGEGVIERRQLLERETILGVEGVQEVEGGVDADVVRVARSGVVGGVER